MKKVILITSKFPYGNSEQFLETEVNYYNTENLSLTIIPTVIDRTIRTTPANIDVIPNIITPKNWKKQKYYYLLRSLLSPIFYIELYKEKLISPKKINNFLSSIALYQFYKNSLNLYIEKELQVKNIIFYTYWNNEITYALQTLKKKYNYQLISRIHRGDLYNEERTSNYIPLKKQFTKNIDTLYTITESANNYLENTYGFNRKIIETSRLGVEKPRAVTLPVADTNKLHFVSCSFLNKVKRVDKIIDALEMLSNKKTITEIQWTHIGSGALLEELLKQAKKKLGDKNNIKYTFLGNLDNKMVLEFYKKNSIDVFINVSESEGVPVSIMEALSYQIPVIAPDIGGVSDLVIDRYNGLLLSKECRINEIIESFKDISFFKNMQTRKHAYMIFLKKYNAKKNYTNFVKKLENL